MASCSDDDDDGNGAPVTRPPEAAAAPLESSSVGSFVGMFSGFAAILKIYYRARGREAEAGMC
eukprot:CAMPEP_0178598088 /NCGR_PEP_ID=MMETSP0697-20121206/32551_1 /TAXON_ID=265572 /ORGANISM="Extubocellulus spinifer, Strain CCMP396" /LENGTH=62 /DNA_ID=CAMNT_0020235823 /DNA_START=12 /DNA_END=200 /DNA_ORIENTATION=-